MVLGTDVMKGTCSKGESCLNLDWRLTNRVVAHDHEKITGALALYLAIVLNELVEGLSLSCRCRSAWQQSATFTT